MRVTTIRFNLKFFNANGGEEVVRTLDDLRDKFNLSDLYDYFKAGDLARWLTSINRPELAEAVVQVSGNPNPHDQVCGLREALKLPIDNAEADHFVSLLERQSKLREKKEFQHLVPEANKAYSELLNDALSASDFQTAKKHLEVFVGNNEYAERFQQHLLIGRILGPECGNLNMWLAVMGKEKWRKYLYRNLSDRVGLVMYHCCAVCPSDDYILVGNVKGPKLIDFDRSLFDVCTSIAELEKVRRFLPPYYKSDDKDLNVYDEKGDPVGKLGTVINEYISW